jgi:DNA end-binding protein Ku
VRDALRSASRVGIGQVALRGREYLVAVRPCGDGLLLETLRYAEELRSADALFAHVDDEPVADELLEVATALIEKKTAPFDASAYTDHYTAALRELVEEKTRRRGARVVDTGDEPRRSDGGGKVIDLMEALRKSLEGSGGRSGAGKRLAEAAKSAKPAPSRATKSATRSTAKPAAKRTTASKKSSAKSSAKAGAAKKPARGRGDGGRKAA